MSRTKPYSRTIPHPLFERLIVEDAMREEKDSWPRHDQHGPFPQFVGELEYNHYLPSNCWITRYWSNLLCQLYESQKGPKIHLLDLLIFKGVLYRTKGQFKPLLNK